jgi:hypothetical protein
MYFLYYWKEERPMKTVYLILAILGAVVPMWFFMQFFASQPEIGFVQSLFVNGATGGFTVDLLISSLVFWLFMLQRKDSSPHPLGFVVINLLIGLSCALPAYLYCCERSKS